MEYKIKTRVVFSVIRPGYLGMNYPDRLHVVSFHSVVLANIFIVLIYENETCSLLNFVFINLTLFPF